jgi:signal transduction histidine kinase
VAREVHDVVAHSLAVTMLHLTAARHALDTDDDVDEAVDSLREAERIGRQAMGDIRRTVGLLDPAGGDTRPLPGVADLPALVEEFRAAGLDVDARCEGLVDDLPPSVALAVYRVAQEALANVAKHAPGARVTLVVEVEGDGVALRAVSMPPPATAGSGSSPPPSRAVGRGVQGMRERVELLGGHLEAGPIGGGWQVAAHIPQRPPVPPRADGPSAASCGVRAPTPAPEPEREREPGA